MPYAHPPPRLRATLAGPLLGACAFLATAGLALERSPFCAADAVERVGARGAVAVPELARDPRLAGTYEVVSGKLTLDPDGRVLVLENDVVIEAGTWRSDADTITAVWPRGSFAAGHEWWKRVDTQATPAAPAAPAATCGCGSC